MSYSSLACTIIIFWLVLLFLQLNTQRSQRWAWIKIRCIHEEFIVCLFVICIKFSWVYLWFLIDEIVILHVFQSCTFFELIGTMTHQVTYLLLTVFSTFCRALHKEDVSAITFCLFYNKHPRRCSLSWNEWGWCH